MQQTLTYLKMLNATWPRPLTVPNLASKSHFSADGAKCNHWLSLSLNGDHTSLSNAQVMRNNHGNDHHDEMSSN